MIWRNYLIWSMSILLALVASYALPPFTDIQSWINPEIIGWISLSGSKYGLPLVGLFFALLLKINIKQWFLALPLVLFLSLFGWLNEHVVKPYFAQPRPNILWLQSQGLMDANQFYQIPNKSERSLYLQPILKNLDLPPAIKQHWQIEMGFSFPSGHTLAAVSLAGFFSLWALYLQKWRLVFLFYIWAVAVAYSRIGLGVHRPIDLIIAGLEGLLIAALSFTLLRRNI